MPQGYYFEELREGLAAAITRTVTDADLRDFAAVSGDTNPLHMDEDFARETRFGGRIAHGMLGGAFLSAVLGTRLPGPGAVYLEQSLQFRAPVRIGDTVESRVTVSELMPEKRIAIFRTECRVATKVVVGGEATMLVPGRQ